MEVEFSFSLSSFLTEITGSINVGFFFHLHLESFHSFIVKSSGARVQISVPFHSIFPNDRKQQKTFLYPEWQHNNSNVTEARHL